MGLFVKYISIDVITIRVTKPLLYCYFILLASCDWLHSWSDVTHRSRDRHTTATGVGGGHSDGNCW